MKHPAIRDTDPADHRRQGRATRPKLASTLVLYRPGTGVLEILMGRRSGKHGFMPNKFVFPGGKVDASDNKAPIATPLKENIKTTMSIYLSKPRMFAAASAAIRETCEETGLKLAVPFHEDQVKGLARTKTCPVGFEAFVKNNLGLDLGRLDLLARAITPPYHPKRFDTWFFSASADNLVDDPRDLASGELEDLQWVAINRAASLDLPKITQMVLRDLLEQQQYPSAPVPFYISRYGNHLRETL